MGNPQQTVANQEEGNTLFAKLSEWNEKRKSFYCFCIEKRWPLIVGFALLFLALLFCVRALQSAYVNITILWGDDADFYYHYARASFAEFVFVSGRPVSRFLMSIGFLMFGTNVSGLLWYWAFFYALAMLALYVLLVYLTRKPLFSLPFLFVALVSRLNWYYYDCAHGIMESSALLFALIGAIFACRFVRSRKWQALLIGGIFATLAMLAHERYLGIVIAIGIAGVILIKGIWPRIIVGASAASSFGGFFLLKTVVANGDFWVVTGHHEITKDPIQLLSNFWRIFVNCFSLDETNHWYSGMSNQMLDGTGRVFMGLSTALAIIGCIFVVYDIILSFIKMDSFHLSFYLILILCFGGITAGGSVSAERIENRWIYGPQVYLICIWALSIVSFRLPEKIAKMRYYRRWYPAAGAGAIAILLVAFLASSGLYVSNNKFQFFVDEWEKQGTHWEQSLVTPFRESGKTKLCICSTDDQDRSLHYLLDQTNTGDVTTLSYEGVWNYPAYEEWQDTYFVRWKDEIATPIGFDYEYHDGDVWVGKNYSFFVEAVSDYLPFSVFKTDNPFHKDNGVSVRINGVTQCYYALDKSGDYLIPLKPNVINFVELIPDFTWNPKEMGLSDDARDLAFLMTSIGSEHVSSIVGASFWTAPNATFSVYSNADRIVDFEFMAVDWPFEQPNGASVYLNKEKVFHGVFDRGLTHCRLPIKGCRASLIEIIPDYSYNPKAMDLGPDTRDLGVYVSSVKEVEENFPTLTSYWTNPVFKMNSFNDSLSALEFTFYGIPWPFETPNGVTIKKDGIEVFHSLIEQETFVQCTLELTLGAYNYIEVIPDYSFVPKEMGLGDDEQTLGVLIHDMHGIPANAA